MQDCLKLTLQQYCYSLLVLIHVPYSYSFLNSCHAALWHFPSLTLQIFLALLCPCSRSRIYLSASRQRRELRAGLAHTPQVNSGTECAGSSHYQDLLSANILGVFGFWYRLRMKCSLKDWCHPVFAICPLYSGWSWRRETKLLKFCKFLHCKWAESSYFYLSFIGVICL